MDTGQGAAALAREERGGRFWVWVILEVCWWLLAVRSQHRRAAHQGGSILTPIQSPSLHGGWGAGKDPNPW